MLGKNTTGYNSLLSNQDSNAKEILPPCDGAIPSTGVPNHIKILEALERLETAIIALDSLKSNIIGEDILENEKVTSGQQCLAVVLSETGDNIDIMTDEIARITTNLRDILL